VAISYIQLCALDEQHAIARRTLKTYEDSVKLFELQHQYGQVSRMTVEQARSSYETAAATIPQLETQIAQTENALSILLGRNPGPIARGRKLGRTRETCRPCRPAVGPA
jgi:multidrug efflux system outer membrane protein